MFFTLHNLFENKKYYTSKTGKSISLLVIFAEKYSSGRQNEHLVTILFQRAM